MTRSTESTPAGVGSPSPGGAVPRRAWWALAAAATAFSLTQINSTATNIAFPSIEATFATTVRTTLAWGLSGYSIVLATFMVFGGRLADLFGRRRVFFLGLGIFVLGSLLCAGAPLALLFIAGRLVQGLGGALLVPSSLALVLPLFPETRRTSAIAAWAATGSIGSAVAPSLSALIVDLTDWRVVYLLPVVFGAGIAAAVRVLLTESAPAQRRARPDLVGMPLGTAALGLLTLAIIEGPHWGWSSPSILACLAGVAALIPLFVWRSLHHPEPLLDLRIFRIRTVWSSNLANVFMSMMGLSVWFIWPLFLTGVWDYSLLQAGLAITPGPVASALSALTAARIAERHGSRELIAVGSLFPIAVMLWMAWRLGPEAHYWTGVFPATTMFGMGFGLTFAPLNSAALAGVAPDAFGEVNAAFNTVRNLGGGLGVAVVVAFLGNERPVPFARFDRVFLVLAFLGALPAIIIALCYPRSSPASRTPRPAPPR